MIPYFTYGTTTVNLNHAIASYDWGQSQDLEQKSIINGNRNYIKLGDYAEVKFTVYLWKHTSGEQTAIKALRGQTGTLYTSIGNAGFYCYSIQYDLMDNLSQYNIATLTFKSTAYV